MNASHKNREDPKNPRAFPAVAVTHGGRPIGYKGMTLRDYLAAQAVTGLMARCPLERSAIDEVPKLAYEFADAMLKVRGDDDERSGGA